MVVRVTGFFFLILASFTTSLRSLFAVSPTLLSFSAPDFLGILGKDRYPVGFLN